MDIYKDKIKILLASSIITQTFCALPSFTSGNVFDRYDQGLGNHAVHAVHNHIKRPKKKHGCCNSFTWFIFNLQRRKIYTVLYNNMQQ
jgi:hypothetical protein